MDAEPPSLLRRFLWLGGVLCPRGMSPVRVLSLLYQNSGQSKWMNLEQNDQRNKPKGRKMLAMGSPAAGGKPVDPDRQESKPEADRTCRLNIFRCFGTPFVRKPPSFNEMGAERRFGKSDPETPRNIRAGVTRLRSGQADGDFPSISALLLA